MFRGPRVWERARGKFFERGDVKYFVLHLLRDKPKHGYEIIKEIEQFFGGFYTPSPGVIYPTLQMLEDLGYVTSTTEDGKRIYQITEEGRRFLEEKDQLVHDIREKVTDFWGTSFKKDVRSAAHEFREFAQTFQQSIRNVRDDPDRLRRVRDVMAEAQREIFEILSEDEEKTADRTEDRNHDKTEK